MPGGAEEEHAGIAAGPAARSARVAQRNSKQAETHPALLTEKGNRQVSGQAPIHARGRGRRRHVGVGRRSRSRGCAGGTPGNAGGGGRRRRGRGRAQHRGSATSRGRTGRSPAGREQQRSDDGHRDLDASMRKRSHERDQLSTKPAPSALDILERTIPSRVRGSRCRGRSYLIGTAW